MIQHRKVPVIRIVLYLLLFTQYSCFTVRSNEHFSYEKLTPESYQTMLSQTGDRYLIDVRTGKEYENGHIANAVNYSYLAFHFRKDVRDLDRNKPVFLYCQTCHRSPLAARKLKKMGFTKVYDLKGGYQKWDPQK